MSTSAPESPARLEEFRRRLAEAELSVSGG